MGYALTKRGFLNLLHRYPPSSYEAFERHDDWFVRPMHHAMKSRDRLHVALRSGLRRLPADKQTIVDLGPYPGSLLQLLHRLDYSEKGCSEKVRLPDNSVQLVFALELIEHLTSPFHLLAEAHRILQSVGHLVLTTPNVTRVGNIFTLLIGRMLNDQLAPPGYNNPDDEWRPHAREYAMHELAEMLCQTGFDLAKSTYFLGEDTQDGRQSISQHGVNWVKWPFYVVPHLRGSLLIVGEKP